MEHNHQHHTQMPRHHHETHDKTTGKRQDTMQHAGHDKHAGHHTQNFLKHFWICLVITIPVLLLSPMLQYLLNFKITFPGDSYVLLALSTIIYFYGGIPFLKEWLER